MKLLTKKLLENGQGYYVAQVGMTQPEAKVLRDLVGKELNRQRGSTKLDNYQHLKNTSGALHDAFNTLKAAYVARTDGRWKAGHKL